MSENIYSNYFDPQITFDEDYTANLEQGKRYPWQLFLFVYMLALHPYSSPLTFSLMIPHVLQLSPSPQLETCIYLPVLAFPVFTLARTRPLRTTAVAQTTRKPLVSNHALRLSAKFGCLVGLNITREWSDVSRAARTHQSGTPLPTAWPDPTACVGMPLPDGSIYPLILPLSCPPPPLSFIL